MYSAREVAAKIVNERRKTNGTQKRNRKAFAKDAGLVGRVGSPADFCHVRPMASGCGSADAETDDNHDRQSCANRRATYKRKPRWATKGAAKQNTERNRRMKRILNALTTKLAGRVNPFLNIPSRKHFNIRSLLILVSAVFVIGLATPHSARSSGFYFPRYASASVSQSKTWLGKPIPCELTAKARAGGNHGWHQAIWKLIIPVVNHTHEGSYFAMASVAGNVSMTKHSWGVWPWRKTVYGPRTYKFSVGPNPPPAPWILNFRTSVRESGDACIGGSAIATTSDNIETPSTLADSDSGNDPDCCDPSPPPGSSSSSSSSGHGETGSVYWADRWASAVPFAPTTY